jgi:hypothetical protein
MPKDNTFGPISNQKGLTIAVSPSEGELWGCFGG